MNHKQPSRRQAKLPVVLSPTEVKALFAALNTRYKLIAGLLYDSGLRHIEAVRLRVQILTLRTYSCAFGVGKDNTA